jgi:hypothetical protein
MIATVPSYTYTNEKQILKFYIRLLLYLEHEDSKNEDLKHDIGHENYLTFVTNALDNNGLDQMFVELLGEIPDKTEAEPLEAQPLEAQGLEAQANLLEAEGLEALKGDALEAQALEGEALEGEALDTDSAQEKGHYYDSPFSKSTSPITRTRIFGNEKDKMINIIKTNPIFENIYDLLSRTTFDAQEQFIKDAVKVFPKSKWTEDTDFTVEDVDKILTTAQRAIEKINSQLKR